MYVGSGKEGGPAMHVRRQAVHVWRADEGKGRSEVHVRRAGEGTKAVCVGRQHTVAMYVRSANEGGPAMHVGRQAVHIGRMDEAVQGRQGAEGKCYSEPCASGDRAWVKLERGTNEAKERPEQGTGTILGDKASARRYLRDLRDLLLPTMKMGL